MKIIKLEELTIGLVVYHAHGLGDQSFVDGPLTITSTPYYKHPKSGIYYIDIERENTGLDFLCPGDANIGKSHNKHWLFTTFEEAQAYVEYCITNNIGQIRSSLGYE